MLMSKQHFVFVVSNKKEIIYFLIIDCTFSYICIILVVSNKKGSCSRRDYLLIECFHSIEVDEISNQSCEKMNDDIKYPSYISESSYLLLHTHNNFTYMSAGGGTIATGGSSDRCKFVGAKGCRDSSDR